MQTKIVKKTVQSIIAIAMLGMIIAAILMINLVFNNIEIDIGTELIITDTLECRTIDNIQNYLDENKKVLDTVSSENEIDRATVEYLYALRFTNEEIKNMSESQIAEYESAEYAKVANITHRMEYTVDNGVKSNEDLDITITTRLLRTPQYDTTVRSYRMEATAYWNKSPSY